jgi:hypothetical protein
VYVPQDPGAADEGAKDERIGFDFGRLFQKGLPIGTGQCPVKRYNEHLRDLIIAGPARPSLLISHELPLEQAPEAYENFDKRTGGYTKVILRPERAAALWARSGSPFSELAMSVPCTRRANAFDAAYPLAARVPSFITGRFWTAE